MKKNIQGGYFTSEKILKGMIVAASVAVLAACGSNEEASSGGMDLAEEGKFTYASSGEFNPFSVTQDDGSMTGFDIEVAEAVAKELD